MFQARWWFPLLTRFPKWQITVALYPVRHRRQYGYWRGLSRFAVPHRHHPLPEFISLSFFLIAVMAIESVLARVADR